MKRTLSLILALVAVVTAWAQNIAVVSPSNATTLYHTLGEAIMDAADGSVVYLPGGGFSIPDSVKINKRLTIMGVSHRGDTDNADGATIISGNLFFEAGSSNSALMGVYLSGEVNIGSDGSAVTDFVMRYCNVQRIRVNNNRCTDMIINQNYIREFSYFSYANPKFTNNVSYAVRYITGGEIKNNVFIGTHGTYCFAGIHSTTITFNIIDIWNSKNTVDYECSNLLTLRNLVVNHSAWGDEGVSLTDVDWEDVFKGASSGISIQSNFNFKPAYSQYSDIGIYGGDNFSDSQLAPIPRIVSKKVDERTDGSGKLNVTVTVKAM